jgi:hypothetical protein
VRIPHLAPLPPGAFRRYGEKAAIAPSTPITDSDNVQNRLTLEKTLTAEPTADAIPPDEWEIIKMGMHGKELTTREILRSAPGRRLKLNAESCSAMFERWAEFGLGRLKTEKLPNGTTQSKFIFEQR